MNGNGRDGRLMVTLVSGGKRDRVHCAKALMEIL